MTSGTSFDDEIAGSILLLVDTCGPAGGGARVDVSSIGALGAPVIASGGNGGNDGNELGGGRGGGGGGGGGGNNR